ncbi:MAG: hypothetical protein WD894_14465 [Pirellulales bacterium]
MDWASPAARSWLITPPSEPTTIGGFLYLTVACLASGLVISTLRWALIDTLHHATGIRPPQLNFSHLDQKLDAFQLLVESHYRYYQFYANMFVAAAVAFGGWLSSTGGAQNSALTTLGFLAVEATLLLGSRDTLRKYYRRSEELLCD